MELAAPTAVFVAGPASDEAAAALADFLVASSGGKAEAIRDQVVYRHGLFTDLPEIAQSMYAAAARHDGTEFDPADFGEFTA